MPRSAVRLLVICTAALLWYSSFQNQYVMQAVLWSGVNIEIFRDNKDSLHMSRTSINGRVLKYAPGCFEVLLCRSFMIKKNGTVALRNTLERISEHAQSVFGRKKLKSVHFRRSYSRTCEHLFLPLGLRP